jgi:hypothetical protein
MGDHRRRSRSDSRNRSEGTRSKDISPPPTDRSKRNRSDRSERSLATLSNRFKRRSHEGSPNHPQEHSHSQNPSTYGGYRPRSVDSPTNERESKMKGATRNMEERRPQRIAPNAFVLSRIMKSTARSRDQEDERERTLATKKLEEMEEKRRYY